VAVSVVVNTPSTLASTFGCGNSTGTIGGVEVVAVAVAVVGVASAFTFPALQSIALPASAVAATVPNALRRV